MNVDAVGINMSQVLNVLFKFKNVIYQNAILNSFFFFLMEIYHII